MKGANSNTHYTSTRLHQHPFGMLMQERSYSSAAYKYGFNGKEKDNEINVDGGDYDFGARIYDGRLGRWLSLDPLKFESPDWSPFKSFLDNPIIYSDPTGGREYLKVIYTDKNGNQLIMMRLAPVSNTLMTDGVQHKASGLIQSGDDDFEYRENYYYDYVTIMNITELADGSKVTSYSYEILYKNGQIATRAVWTDGDKPGDKITDYGAIYSSFIGEKNKRSLKQSVGWNFTLKSVYDPTKDKAKKVELSVDVKTLLAAVGKNSRIKFGPQFNLGLTDEDLKELSLNKVNEVKCIAKTCGNEKCPLSDPDKLKQAVKDANAGKGNPEHTDTHDGKGHGCYGNSKDVEVECPTENKK